MNYGPKSLKTYAFLALAGAALYAGSASAAPLVEAPALLAERTTGPDEAAFALADNLRRQMVAYSGGFAAGTVVVDTQQTYLYYVLGNGQAVRYGIGVGREGFTWAGTETVTRKAEWPDWTPPAEMIARQPYLARWMAGGEGNPLGARAIYLGNTVYRIHGTNMPSTIGTKVSSGCIRMLNEDVIDLYGRISTGTKIVVLPNNGLLASVAIPVARLQRTSAIY